MHEDQPGEGLPEDQLSVEEAAVYKDVHRSTIYKAVREGRLQTTRAKPPYLIHRAVLDNWFPKKYRDRR